MTRYLVQIRLVRLPNPDDEPDRWSSATSTMTDQEVSVPFDAEDSPELTTSHAYLDAVTRAIGLLANVGKKRPWPDFLVVCDYEKIKPHELNDGHLDSEQPNGRVCHNPRPAP